MQLPLSTSELTSYLPHKPPMVWIDEVMSISESEMVCKTVLKKNAHYFSEAGFRPSSFVELMAQGYAFCSIAKELTANTGKKVNKAFLVGVTNAKFNAEKVSQLNELYIKLETEREMLPVILFKGTVLDSENNLLAEARLKVFAGE